jgi:hypothetical protein
MINYVLEFLLGSTEYVRYVGYSKDSTEWKNYKVVIVPSSFLEEHKEGKVQMPQLPLKQLDGMPILFGEPQVKQVENTLVVYADLVASAVFLLSRYEETLVSERDLHGRFQAKSSLLYKAGCLMRPLVDEYGSWLRAQLQSMGVGVQLPNTSLKITLTHDVDEPFVHRSLKSLLGGIMRGETKTAWRNFTHALEQNSYYTFPWIVSQEAKLPYADKIYFMRMPLQPFQHDKPYVSYQSKDMRALVALLKKNKVQIGLHASYFSGENPQIIGREKIELETAIQQSITTNRYHFLRTCLADDMSYLADAGIKDDYTLAFADQVGFRLGTCRPVAFISPKTLKTSNLILHPLTMMDATLFRYMQLSLDDAFKQACCLIETVRQYGGELVMLWHNTMLHPQQPSCLCYQKILEYLALNVAEQAKKM